MRRFGNFGFVLVTLAALPAAQPQPAAGGGESQPPAKSATSSDDPARLKQTFDSLLQQATNALASGEAAAALEALSDAKLILDKRVKAKSAAYNSPEHVALLHGIAIAYQLLDKPEKASPLFDENTPLDRACDAPDASRQLLITRGFMDATQGYLAMRTVVRLKQYLEQHPSELDSDLMDVMISALIKADERVQNRALMLEPAIKLYEQYNAKLETTRPGRKRWGIKWVSPGEYRSERTAREQALRDWQRKVNVAADRAADVKDAERHLENAKKGGTASKARATAASQALAAARRRLSEADAVAAEAKAKIPPVPVLAKEDFKRLVAPGEEEIAAAKANQTVASAQPLRLGGTKTSTAKLPGANDVAPTAVKSSVFDAPAAAPPSRRTFTRYTTGFAVAPDLILTTSAVGGAKRVMLEFPNAAPVEATLERTDGDLALIRLRGHSMSYLNLAESFPGGAVQCPAYPEVSIFGVKLETLSGRATAPKTTNDWTVALNRHPRLPGSPLVDSSGNLVGVVTATREDAADRLAAVRIDTVQSFLAADLPPQTCATPRSAPVVQIVASFER